MMLANHARRDARRLAGTVVLPWRPRKFAAIGRPGPVGSVGKCRDRETLSCEDICNRAFWVNFMPVGKYAMWRMSSVEVVIFIAVVRHDRAAGLIAANVGACWVRRAGGQVQI
jgi:hypothetical protein